uniref:Uncharacterized protein n=1 Tax=Plectus sambesii TaxID=2011161 RepID=A0A914W007_9BILA
MNTCDFSCFDVRTSVVSPLRAPAVCSPSRHSVGRFEMKHPDRGVRKCLRRNLFLLYTSIIVVAILFIFIAASSLSVHQPQQILLQRVWRRNIGIFIAIDNYASLPEYRTALDSVTCYAKIANYSLEIVYLNESKYDELCPHKDPMFKRHCVAVQYLSKYEWMLFLDADIGVINPNHRIEEWIDDRVSIIFYDRFFNWEVASGSYLVKNTDYAKDFLKGWASYEWKLPHSFHGTDNGAIHTVLLNELAPYAQVEESQLCHKLWNQSRSFGDLFAFEACIRFLLGAQRFWPGKVKIVPKGKGWARDGWLTSTKWSSNDFMFHGWQERRENDNNAFGPWMMPFVDSFNMSRCSQKDGYSNWKWLPQFRTTDENIAELLVNYARTVNRQFWAKTGQIAKQFS